MPRNGFTYRSAAGSRGVELVCGAATLIAGPVLQIIGTRAGDLAVLIVGGILTTVGGVLLSWSASLILADKNRSESDLALHGELDQKLDNLSRVLGQAAGQISQAVDQAEVGQISASTGFSLISQANRMIYGQVNEISVIRGAKFDAARLLETASTLDQLAKQLSGKTSTGSAGEDNEAIQAQLASIQSQLASASPQRTLSQVQIACPYCATVNDVVLGSIPGDTAARTCASCGKNFNTHRSATGEPFARAVPAAAAQQQIARMVMACPRCSTPVQVRKDGRGIREMVCPHCFAALSVDPENDVIVIIGDYRVVDDATFEVKSSRPQFICPDCRRKYNAPVVTERGYTGICTADRIAMVVAVEEYESVRNGG